MPSPLSSRLALWRKGLWHLRHGGVAELRLWWSRQESRRAKPSTLSHTPGGAAKPTVVRNSDVARDGFPLPEMREAPEYEPRRDHVLYMTTSEQWQNALRTWFEDKDARLRTVWAQMRTVLRTHRADQALTLMLRTAGIAVDPRPMRRCAWPVHTPEDVEAAARQSLPPAVLTADPRLTELAQELGVHTAAEPAAGDWLMQPALDLPQTLVEDLLLATLFTDADVISARRGGDQADPLIARGRGESALTMWRADLDAPENGRNPFTWRIPKDL